MLSTRMAVQGLNTCHCKLPGINMRLLVDAYANCTAKTNQALTSTSSKSKAAFRRCLTRLKTNGQELVHAQRLQEQQLSALHRCCIAALCSTNTCMQLWLMHEVMAHLVALLSILLTALWRNGYRCWPQTALAGLGHMWLVFHAWRQVSLGSCCISFPGIFLRV